MDADATLALLLEDVIDGASTRDADTSRAVLEQAARFAVGVLQPLAARTDATGCRIEAGRVRTAPGHVEAWCAYANGGWAGLTAPETAGGQAQSMALAAAVQEILDAADPAFGMLAINARCATRLLAQHGDTEQKATWLPQLAAGVWGATICISEPQAGSDIGRIPNQEVADAAAANSDMMMAFASIDPHKGRMGVHEARDLIQAGIIKGFKFHPTLQGFFPNDRMAYQLYEVIAEYKLPAIFHSGHSGIGTGMPGGGGLKLKYSNPIHVDDVAADFPDMTVIIAHPSWPWQDEALSVCLHKPNVYIDLSGWSPKYFPKDLITRANGQLKHKMLFGSDFPLIAPDRWIADFKDPATGFKPEVHDLILKQNAIHALKLDRAAA